MLDIAFLCHLLKSFREDRFGKHVGIAVFGLFLQHSAVFVHAVKDGFDNHPVGLGEVPGIHQVDFGNDIREQVAFLVGFLALTAFFGLQRFVFRFR